MPNSPAHIYVIEHADGIVKVGYTQNAKARMGIHFNAARDRGASVTRSWVSEPHTNASANEAGLIDFCLSQGGQPIEGSHEYFTGIAYDTALSFAQSLPFREYVGPHQITSLLQARQSFGHLVERAECAGEVTIITRQGRPVVAIVPMHLVP